MFSFLLDKKSDSPQTKLVDVCIPAYKEGKYLEETLYHLTQQIVYQNGYVGIVVGEYKDDYSDMTVKNICDKYRAKYVHVDRRGIAYARNICVLNSTAPFIMNMDADAHFQYNTGIYYMLIPLLENKDVMLTNCEIIYPSEVESAQKRNKTIEEYIYNIAHTVGNYSERVLTARGPGMTFRRFAWEAIGGFPDVKAGEDYLFAGRICYKFTWDAKVFVPNVKIIASDRRIQAAKRVGIPQAFNYDNEFR